MKVYLVLLAAIAVAVMACSPTKDKETQEALKYYTHFVDSIDALNTVWQSAVDTDFVEIPTDPNDPTSVRLDTIVTLPEDKGHSMFSGQYFREMIQKEYEPLKVSLESRLDKMDEGMKKEYQQATEKYESLIHE
jgi:hypothetical protein